jgi:hypothetical protein
LVWPKDAPDTCYYGVALDMSPYGMRVRMLDPLEPGMAVCVQMMRDDDFELPLADPLEATVARCQSEAEGFVDHGIQIIRKQLKRGELPAARTAQPRPRKAAPTHAYALDIRIGERPQKGTGR